MMILLIQYILRTFGPHHIMDTMTGLAIGGCGGMCVSRALFLIGQTIAAFPALPPIFCGKDTGNGYPDPEFVRLFRMRHDGMENKPGSTRIPALG